MKKKFIPFIAFLLFLITFVACNKEENKDYFDEPIDVPFTELVMCQIFRGIDPSGGEVVIINSEKELNLYLTCCIKESTFPVIDFSKYTVLYAAFGTRSNFVRCIRLLRLSPQSYEINIVMGRGQTKSFSAELNVFIITHRLNDNDNVKLNIIYY